MKAIRFSVFLLIFAILSFCLLPVPGNAYGGTDGDLTWRLEDGCLTVSGEGTMPEIWHAPWAKHAALITDVVLDPGITTIPEYALKEFVNLRSITLPASLKKIGRDAFSDALPLEAVHISDIGAWAQIEFTNLNSNPLRFGADLYLNGQLVTEAVIGPGCQNISNYAFYGYKHLQRVTVAEGVTIIGSQAFYQCTALSSLTLPASLRVIDSAAFSGCDQLTDVNFNGTIEDLSHLAVGTGNTPITDAQLQFTDTSKETMVRNHLHWGLWIGGGLLAAGICALIIIWLVWRRSHKYC